MPAEHPLLPTLADHPSLNRPLALAARTLLESRKLISVIDVGANIGETVAIIEQVNSGKCIYLCIEPEPDIVELCRRNHDGNERVIVKEAVIGEREDMSVVLKDDGRANPSVKLAAGGSAQKLSRLDNVAGDFIESHGVDLIKTDTEGYDFTVLRSAESILCRHHPAVFFEWYPELLLKVGESPGDIFSFLGQFGYRHWVFFTASGQLYCETSEPPLRTVEVLAKVALAGQLAPYFDVFGSTDEKECRRLTDSYLI
jgi:FkbM family methyltransferase